MTTHLDPWIEGYLEYLSAVRRLAKGTIRDIRCSLKKLSVFMSGHSPGKALWQLELEAFLAWVNHERDLGRSELTTAKKLAHLRGLLDYSWKTGRAARNVLDGFSLQDGSGCRKPPARVLSLDEARALVGACVSNTFSARRNRIIVLLLYGCGFRNMELCHLDHKDVDLERREIFVRFAKNDRQRRVPVPPAVWTELLAYLAERPGKAGPLIRTDCKKTRVKGSYVADIVRTAARLAGISGNITPKVLRHSFGSHLADQGVDIAVIATLMGHRSPRETSVYLHTMEGNKEDAVSRLVAGGGEA